MQYTLVCQTKTVIWVVWVQHCNIPLVIQGLPDIANFLKEIKFIRPAALMQCDTFSAVFYCKKTIRIKMGFTIVQHGALMQWYLNVGGNGQSKLNSGNKTKLCNSIVQFA